MIINKPFYIVYWTASQGSIKLTGIEIFTTKAYRDYYLDTSELVASINTYECSTLYGKALQMFIRNKRAEDKNLIINYQ